MQGGSNGRYGLFGGGGGGRGSSPQPNMGYPASRNDGNPLHFQMYPPRSSQLQQQGPLRPVGHRAAGFRPDSSGGSGGFRPELGGGFHPDSTSGGFRPELGGGFRPDLGGSYRPELGGSLHPDSGGSFRPESGGFRPEPGGFRPDSGGFRPEMPSLPLRQVGFEQNPTNQQRVGFELGHLEEPLQARTVHQQLGFESDSPDASTSPMSEPPLSPPIMPEAPLSQKKQQEGGEVNAPVDPSSGMEDDGDDEGGAAGAANRWPRKETIALLTLRAEMDNLFREPGAKWSLWEEISRKLADMGLNRSAKKCKEKFENVYKYYKKTKEGKATRPERKNYCFFSQLEAIYVGATSGSGGGSHIPKRKNTTTMNKSAKIQEEGGGGNGNALLVDVFDGTPSMLEKAPPPFMDERGNNHHHRVLMDMDDCGSPPPFHFSSPSESSDGESESPTMEGGKKRKKKSSKERLMRVFERAMKRVVRRQEQLHRDLFDALERREADRMAREESWRRQEMARLGKEAELKSQERAAVVSRDAALVSFLEQTTGQSFEATPLSLTPPPIRRASADITSLDTPGEDDNSKSLLDPNSKRWPKQEVLALIKFRSALEPKFRENGPKGRIWKEVSREMASLGFQNRSARRCREKWENINKYFLRTRDRNKKRSENSKTCPYFDQLDALYRKGLLGPPPQHLSSIVEEPEETS